MAAPSRFEALPHWLFHSSSIPVSVQLDPHENTVSLSNGLIERTFLVKPNLATVSLRNLQTGEEFVRATEPEAAITIDGKTYQIGGLNGQPDRAFLLQKWWKELTTDPQAFQFSGYKVGPVLEPFPWKPARESEGRWGGAGLNWPPKGKRLDLTFQSPNGPLSGMEVIVSYELYQGVPILMKQISVKNGTIHKIRIDSWTVEKLALAESESAVGSMPRWIAPNIFVVSDYAFSGDNAVNSNQVVNYLPDPAYETQVNYDLKTPCLMECKPKLGPGTYLEPGQHETSFRVFEMPYSSSTRETRGLEERHFYETMAPWSQENPLMFHLVASDPDRVKEGIDQAAKAGFEMVILSFGSGLNMEDVSPANISKYKALADYAHSKGIALGGYSLLASRSIDAADDVINPETGKPGGAVFGSSPCLGSVWGIDYLQHIKTFLRETGFDLLENDGSYPGDICASTTHPGHHDLEDSQWTQWKQITSFYQWCRSQGIFLNVPDWYFLAGSNKSGMGYRETNWSLPRHLQLIHNRQNLYDGTWGKTPSMGWTFVPLTEYQGGGSAATIEPLHEHLDTYGAFLETDLGYGAQACYRGLRLFDSPETLAVVQKWVKWFKTHRAILQSDVIHLGRPNGNDLDAVLHINPSLAEPGLLMVFNSSDESQSKTFSVPAGYFGSSTSIKLVGENGKAQVLKSNKDGLIEFRERLDPNSIRWYVISPAHE